MGFTENFCINLSGGQRQKESTIMLHMSGQMIRNSTYLLPNIIQTYTMNIELTPMTEFQFRVDPHSNI